MYGIGMSTCLFGPLTTINECAYHFGEEGNTAEGEDNEKHGYTSVTQGRSS